MARVTTCCYASVVKHGTKEGGRVMTCRAISPTGWDMCHRLYRLRFHPGKYFDACVAMTQSAIACYTGVVHPRAGESIGIGMAGFTRQQSREVGSRLAHNAQ